VMVSGAAASSGLPPQAANKITSISVAAMDILVRISFLLL
jgi:hypothetical protein